MTVKIYYSNSTNPWFNLATEDWLFQEKLDADHVLFLWRNQPTVVIGRSQNPWAECHLENMQQDNVLLARRQSGGGAVFHDLGNTNFTFISSKKNYNKAQNMAIILDALQACGISATASGRNDIVTIINGEQRKISGNAFKEKIDRAFHHGAILVNVDMSQLARYLNPSEKKLEAKGVKSVRSRVANLVEINPKNNHEIVCEAIERAFLNCHKPQPDGIKRIWLDPNSLQLIPTLMQFYEKMRNWEWLYGQTLEFTHRIEERLDWGMVDLQLVVRNGVIDDLRIYSDSLYPDLVDRLALELKGQIYNPESIMQFLKNCNP